MAGTVSLADLAERVGGSLDDAVRTVEQANGRARNLRLTVPADVADALADTYAQVREIVREEQRDLAMAKSAYAGYVDDHARARNRVGADAYNKAYEAQRQRELAAMRETGEWSLPTGYTGGGSCRTAGREARAKALEHWDRRHPLLDLPTFRRRGSNL